MVTVWLVRSVSHCVCVCVCEWISVGGGAWERDCRLWSKWKFRTHKLRYCTASLSFIPHMRAPTHYFVYYQCILPRPPSHLFPLSPFLPLLPTPTQVLQLLTEHDGTDDREVADMKAKVESLLDSYRQVETNGHRELNHIRGIASSLEWEWTRFYSDVEQRHKNLHLSLNFQDNLFEV